MGNRIRGFISENTLKIVAFLLAAVGKVMLEAGQGDYLKYYEENKTVPTVIAILAVGGLFLFYCSLPMIGMVLTKIVKTGENLGKKTILFGTVAVIDEFLYDLLSGGTDVFNGRLGFAENVYLRTTCAPLSLFIGFLAILFIDKFVKKKFDRPLSVGYILLCVLTILVAALLSSIINSELGIIGVFFTVYVYQFSDSPVFLILAVAGTLFVTLGFADPPLMYGPIVGTVVLWFCTDEKGKYDRFADYFALLGYPVISLLAVFFLTAL